MTVFYGVDPSDVRKQTGEFGIVFNETCARKTEEEKRKWSQALSDVGNIAGEHFANCNLPLGLRVMGSSLRGKREADWEYILHRLENSLDRKIEVVLRVGYDNLHKDDQLLFLLIAVFFNNKDDDHVKSMLGDSNLNIILGLKTLAYKSLIQISTKGNIVMHKLLQQVGREVVQRQDLGKRQILIDTNEIGDVLENDSGSRSVMGISFDISTLPNDVYISAGAFKRIYNLRFLSIYKKRFDANDRVHVPEDMVFPPRLRLLHWEVYPGKCLPHTFRPENLVELNLRGNQLEKLWEGIQPLTNLKKMDLYGSLHLKELSDLSNATNLERLDLVGCESLEEIHSSIGNLHKLELLDMDFCIKLQVVPTHFNLASLKRVDMMGCWQLKKIPDISQNITELTIADTMLEDLPESMKLWSRLQILTIYGSVNIYPIYAGLYLKRTGADIEEIPDCIKDLQGIKELKIYGCPKLASLPELPRSLRRLTVHTCESFETLIPFQSPIEWLSFPNCFKSLTAWLPGRTMHAEFDHRAIGNSLTIPSETYQFRLCILISPIHRMLEVAHLLCLQRINGILIWEQKLSFIPMIQTEHVFILHDKFTHKLDSEILLEFITTSKNIDIIGCGLQILTDKTDKHKRSQGSYEPRSEQMSEDDDENEDLSDGSYESRSVELSEDEDNEDLSDGSFESHSEQVSEDDDDDDLSDGSFKSCSEQSV